MLSTRRNATLGVALVLSLVTGAAVPATGAAAAAASDPVAVVVRAQTPDQAAAAVVAAGGTVDAELPVVGGVAAQLPSAAVQALNAGGDVDVVLDTPMEFAATDAAEIDAAVAAGTQLEALNPGEHWSPEAGAGVGVALIDTGVVETSALQGRVIHGPDYSDEKDGVDRHGHGTFMAGLIAGNTSTTTDDFYGSAPGSHIVSLKLAGRDGVTSMSKVLDAIGWVVLNRDEYGIRVLNLSVGVPTDRAPQADPLSAAVQAAWASGITVVAASGNEGSGTVTSPGRDPWVITVGATDTNGTADTGDDTVPSWSGSGKVTKYHKAEVAAPGSSVISLRVPGSGIDESFPDARIGDDYFRGSGTSMSAALVSGAVATLAEFRPHATPDDLKGALVSTGAPIDGSTAVAVDVAAADAAPADDAWRQDHKIASNRLGGELKDGMPWAGKQAPAPDETWQRMSWADGEWQRMSWADAEFARMSWARMSWADTEFARMTWARMSWAEANFARMSWADAHFTRMSWARMSWARMSWAGDNWGRDTSWSDVDWVAAAWDGPPAP